MTFCHEGKKPQAGHNPLLKEGISASLWFLTFTGKPINILRGHKPRLQRNSIFPPPDRL